MNTTAFAHNLERLRRAAGLNKKELANAAGLTSASVLTLYEQGKIGRPGVDILHRLARALGVTVDDLLADRRANTREGDAESVTLSMEEKMQEIALQTAKSVLEEWIERHSYQNPTNLTLAPNQIFDRMEEPEEKGKSLPEGYERAEVFGLRASADAGRILLHDDAGEQPIEVVMVKSSRRGHEGSKIIGLQVHGECLAPLVPDGALVLVGVERPGDVIADLNEVVGDIVFACVGDDMHVKFLERTATGYQLAQLNGETAIPVTDDVRVVGVVIEVRFRPGRRQDRK